MSLTAAQADRYVEQREWAAEVAAWRASRKTAREFCEERGYSATRLYWWSSQLKHSEDSTKGKTGVAIARRTKRGRASFFTTHADRDPGWKRARRGD